MKAPPGFTAEHALGSRAVTGAVYKSDFRSPEAGSGSVIYPAAWRWECTLSFFLCTLGYVPGEGPLWECYRTPICGPVWR